MKRASVERCLKSLDTAQRIAETLSTTRVPATISEVISGGSAVALVGLALTLATGALAAGVLGAVEKVIE